MTDGIRPYSRRRVPDTACDMAPDATRFPAGPGAWVAQPPSTRRAVLQKETV